MLIIKLIMSIFMLIMSIYLIWASYGNSDYLNEEIQKSIEKRLRKGNVESKEELVNYYMKSWRIGGYLLVLISILFAIFTIYSKGANILIQY